MSRSEHPEDGPPPRLARPYAVVGGRTTPAQPRLAVEALVSTTEHGLANLAALSLEHRDITDLCREPHSVAEVAARLRLPYGVARVLVGDLASSGLVSVHGAADPDGPDDTTLEEVLHALRAR
ncbi:MAG: DUF742 domain-containing protein [Acidimicrobiia bacterium]|nr:DUF742 domain-containing protein [Acidimicrobiia bacterium]